MILLKYIQVLQWFAVSDRLHLSERRLQQIMHKALNDFGIAYSETLREKPQERL